MFWSKNKKNRYTPPYPSFAILKWRSRGYTLHGHVFVMMSQCRLLFNCVNSFLLFDSLLYALVNSFVHVGTLAVKRDVKQ